MEPRIARKMGQMKHDLQAVKAVLSEYFEANGHSLLSEVARHTGRTMYAKTFHAYLTLLQICPYDEERRSFLVVYNGHLPRQLKIICHEIMHFQFLHYYRAVCKNKGLNEKQIQDLKEAMTVLLNQPSFRRFHLAYDQGYEPHQELRKFITTAWHARRSYRFFLDRCIEKTKQVIPRT